LCEQEANDENISGFFELLSYKAKFGLIQNKFEFFIFFSMILGKARRIFFSRLKKQN